MPFVPALGVAQVELRCLQEGQRVENTLYFYLGANPVDSDFEDLNAQIAIWWENAIAPLVVTTLSLVEIYTTDLSSQFAPTFSLTAGLPAQGENAGSALPNNNTLAISFRTNGRGRSSRGRNYLLGLSDAGITANEVDVAYAQQFVTAYNQLLPAGGVITPGIWGVLSRYTNGQPRAQGLFQPITNVVVTDYVVDSQRRRLPTRGD